MIPPGICCILLLLLYAHIAVPAQPRLLTRGNTGRAIALDSPTMTPEPFRIQGPVLRGTDARARVMLFAQNATGDITVTATDHLNVRHTLPVEDAGPLQDVPCITQIVVILDPGLDDIGDLAVRITASGQESNDALIGIGPINPNTPSRFALADWDAATLGESQNISVWKDSSGNHNDAIQSNPARQPAVSTNRDGIRSVRFDAFQYLQFPQLSNVRIVQAVIKYDLSLDNTDRLPPIIDHTINITWSGSEGTHIFGKDTSLLVTGGARILEHYSD
jgi:hypothetical protein